MLRKIMEPITVGDTVIAFGIDSEGNEFAYYSNIAPFDDGAGEKAPTVEYINTTDIADTIELLEQSGKTLPQRDRIRAAKNPEEERAKVVAQTVKLWWGIFGSRKISKSLWQKATEKALLLGGVARLDTNQVSPSLLQYALVEAEKDGLAERGEIEQRLKLDRMTAPKYPFPEMGKLMEFHFKHHHSKFIPLPSPETVTAWAKHGGWKDATIEKNMIKLRLYYNFGQYAKRDGAKMPLKLIFKQGDIVCIEFVD